MKKFKELKTKGKILCISIIVFSLAVLGFGTYVLISLFSKDKSTLDIPDEETLISFEDDTQALMNKLSTLPENADYSTSFEAPELVEISFEKMKSHNYVVSYQYGLAQAMKTNQTVRSCRIKNGNDYFLENISNSSLVHAARRSYQDATTVKNYEGKNVKTTTATWSEDRLTTYSIEDYVEEWGKDISRPLIHIISTKTATGTATKVNNEYHVSLSLDKDSATPRYAKQIVAISNVKNPVFESIEMQFILNENLDLVSYHSEEHYKVDIIFKGVETYTRVSEYYTYDEEAKIPDLNTNITYESGDLYGNIY